MDFQFRWNNDETDFPLELVPAEAGAGTSWIPACAGT